MNTKSNIFKTIFRYAIPSVLSMWMFTLYSIVDGIFIGKYIGTFALAGVSLSLPITNFIFAIGIMIAVGSSTQIAANYGSKNIISGNKVFTLAVSLTIIVGISTSLVSLFFIDTILNFLAPSQTILPYLKDYLHTLSFFFVFYMFSYGLEVYIKVDGNPFLPAISVLIGGVFNLVFDYILIVHFNLGMNGAAFATGFSQVVTSLILFYYIIFKAKNLRFVKFKFSFKKIMNILKIGFSEFLTELSSGIIILLFNFSILYYIDDTALSAFGAIVYISSFVIMTMIGFCQGVQPIISYNLGLKNLETVKKSLYTTIVSTFIMGLIFYATISLFSDFLISNFIKDRAVAIKAESYLKLYGLSYIVAGVNISISSYYTAIKQVKYALIITTLRGFVICAISLLILPNIFPQTGIWIALFVSESLTLLVSYYFIKFKNVF